MRLSVTSILILGVAVAGLAQEQSIGQRMGRMPGRRDNAQAIVPDPASCALPLTAIVPDLCTDGTIGSGTPETFSAISKAEANEMVRAAATALAGDTGTIAIVDRTGRPVAVFRQKNANPANDDIALGVARTSAFFSNSQAPSEFVGVIAAGANGRRDRHPRRQHDRLQPRRQVHVVPFRHRRR